MNKLVTNSLENINQKLSEIIIDLDNCINNNLKTSFQIKSHFAQDGIGIDYLDLNYSGVYLIEVLNEEKNIPFANWIDEFSNKWMQFSGNFTPSIIKKRKSYHIDKRTTLEWIPLYLGISQKISDRVKGHIDLKMGQKTFALKLAERTNLKGKKFRLSTIRIDVNLDVYELMLPRIEKKLREVINPIVGRQ